MMHMTLAGCRKEEYAEHRMLQYSAHTQHLDLVPAFCRREDDTEGVAHAKVVFLFFFITLEPRVE